MKKFGKILLFYALIPFVAGLPGFLLNLSETFYLGNIVLVPALTVVIYILLRKKLDTAFAVKVNGITLLALLILFVGMTAISKGNLESDIMLTSSLSVLPLYGGMAVLALMNKNMVVFLIGVLTYMAAFIVCAILEKIQLKKILIPVCATILCIGVGTFLYANRPSVKYGGHGFEYMHGFSSTDFSDYTVYAQNSKLAKPDHTPSFSIENPEDMPVLDGAEACYPLYAAFAKAVYKDIDRIELSASQSKFDNYNGQIVSFTNTISAFVRLLYGGHDFDNTVNGIDMFFGARPSQSQMDMAEEYTVDIQVTPIAKEAFVFFVEEDNPVDNLTSEQVKAIYHGDITNWSELGGKNQKILAFQRPKNSGSQTMMEFFMDGVTLKEPKTYETRDSMSGVIKQVAQYTNAKGAIGYSFRYFLEELNQEKGVKMLSIDGVYPSLENIENGSYPLITNVCVITREHESNPNVQRMIDFILSEDGQTIIRKTGYAGITER